MLKKLLTISLIACFSAVSAQNIELRKHGGASTLINGTTIDVIDTVGVSLTQDVEVKIDAKSTYTSTKTIRVKKIELTTSAPLSENAICWGVCTIGTVWAVAPTVISDPVPMTAAQTILYSGHVYPKKQGGNSCFRYIWFDVANPNDSTWVDVCFKVRGYSSLTEIKKQTSLKLFPNPARDIVTIAVESSVNNKTIAITDMLGRRVYSKNTQNKKDNVSVNTSNFRPGVYFVSITADNKVIKTEKLVITN